MSAGGLQVASERVEHHQNSVLSVAYCSADNTVLSGAEDGSVSLFSSKDSTQIHHMTLARDGLSRDDPVNCVTFNPRETARFYVAVDNVIFVYDKRQLNVQCDTYKVHDDEINQVAVDEKGQYLVSCDDEGVVACVDIKKSGGKVVSKNVCHDNICATVQWVPSRTAEVLTGGMDCKIHHRDLYKKRSLKTITEPTQQEGVHVINPPFVNCVATHWESRYMAAGYGSGAVKVWRLGSRKMGYIPFRSLAKHGAGAGCVSMIDSSTVVSGGNDCFIHISSLEGGDSNGAPHIGSDVEEETDTTFKLFHGQKINWLTGHKSDGIVELYVCDESSVVTKYTVR